MADPTFRPQRSRAGSESAIGRVSTAQLGLYVTLASLTMLFGASLVAYLITRAQNDIWRTADMPPLPLGLVASSVLLIGITVSFRWARKALERNAFTSLERALWLAGAFAVAFLLAQIQNWRTMASASLPTDAQTLYAFTFYALTAVHALHVLVGLVPLGIVIVHARTKQYSSSRPEGVRLCAQYWDYLLVVWLVLLTTISLAT